MVGALLADSSSRSWSNELCEMIGWAPETLPPVVDPTAIVGEITPAAAAECGLQAGTPVVCGSNDTTVELFGVGAIRPGEGAVKLAMPGCFIRSRMARSCARLCRVIRTSSMASTTPQPGINACASAHRWLRDQFFATEGFDGMDALASDCATGE